ncbi:methyl esterase 1 [Euphorbia peplus]|nr:methyl esterase 1 [Euphorbia peplus]
MEKKQHIVVVHGAGHGAWIWYKVKPMLESAGHHVTALDMAASGIHPAKIQEVNTLVEYTQPLLDFLACLPPQEKVVLVGTSLGGMNIALAMETFPEKIAVGVFVTGFMPDTEHSPSFIVDEFLETTPEETWMDTKFFPYSSCLPNQIALLFGPKYLALVPYHLSPIEDLELGKLLNRPASFFQHDLSTSKYFTSARYGSVRRVYIIAEDSIIIPMKFQKWMIENYPVDQVFLIKDADTMTMFSKPKELAHHLSNIASNYA